MNMRQSLAPARRKATLIALTAVIAGSAVSLQAPVAARCGEGFKQLGGSNRCIPIDTNDHKMMVEHCNQTTRHYGNISLQNGTTRSLEEYYAACMGFRP